MSKRTIGCLALVMVILCLAGVLVYQLPPVNDRLSWRLEAASARLRYAINPPEQAIFQPAGEPLPAFADQLPTATPAPTATFAPTLPGPTNTPEPTPTATQIPTPLPPLAMLEGFSHIYQSWNNCGPANLAMALTYWGWEGGQQETAAYTKPNKRDKNVMPYEMVDFVNSQTELRALMRVGGDLQLLKAFIAAGFPVIVEKGFEGVQFDGWMGHYQVVNGYDDAEQMVYVQDSYDGPNLKVSYEDLLNRWRAFNYTYIVPYPVEREGQVLQILGGQTDPLANFQSALKTAEVEAASLSGRDQYFALFNRGTNLVYLHDYQTAATVFDAAFANYPTIPNEQRPWRMLWYQTGPYFAYFYTGRYQDVIDLATTTLKPLSEQVLEESYYWRGMAYQALGDNKAAIADFRAALKAHPGFQPALDQLAALGETP